MFQYCPAFSQISVEATNINRAAQHLSALGSCARIHSQCNFSHLDSVPSVILPLRVISLVSLGQGRWLSKVP